MIRAGYLFFLRLLKAYGIDLRVFGRAVTNTPRFLRDYGRYRQTIDQASDARAGFPLHAKRVLPCLTDFDDAAGALGSYFHQDLWAARKVYERKPQRHVDIGSRIDGFVGHLLVFMPVEIVDVRTMTSNVKGMSFVQADATRLDMFETNSVQSISSLHAAEHFGLGRYGEPVDPNSCFDFMRALQRVVSPGGTLLFSVPIGEEGVFFNAHRVFSPQTILKTFDGLTLRSFSAVQGRSALVEDVDPSLYLKNQYKVGLFDFTKATA